MRIGRGGVSFRKGSSLEGKYYGVANAMNVSIEFDATGRSATKTGRRSVGDNIYRNRNRRSDRPRQ